MAEKSGGGEDGVLMAGQLEKGKGLYLQGMGEKRSAGRAVDGEDEVLMLQCQYMVLLHSDTCH